ncbi:hypothetical protein GGX14DRAFT_354956 [Mycena pura]|uniref:Ubiquitin-like domain-containing protein n=1 Tax=Mycena pura TaxID=153505 RepID=A0AAD6VQJ4_9AGAR|nr:hypothetical protein GGX14DRAFT_354956 [Mycena pura]
MCSPWCKTITINCEPSDSVSVIKIKVQDKTGISPDEYDITFASQHMLDDLSLGDYSLDSDVTYQTKFRPYTIYIRAISGKTIEIACLPWDRVSSIKREACAKEGLYNSYDYDLVFGSEVLKDNLPLSRKFSWLFIFLCSSALFRL